MVTGSNGENEDDTTGIGKWSHAATPWSSMMITYIQLIGQ